MDRIFPEGEFRWVRLLSGVEAHALLARVDRHDEQVATTSLRKLVGETGY